jgi:hypothetical protein
VEGVSLFALDPIEQATFAAFRPVSLLRFQQTCLPQIMDSTAYSGF